MDAYKAAEAAYKNGYEQGKKDAVVHGRWIHREYDESDDSDEYYYCSECHKIALYEFGKYTFILSDYCPNCGAKMYGGE